MKRNTDHKTEWYCYRKVVGKWQKAIELTKINNFRRKQPIYKILLPAQVFKIFVEIQFKAFVYIFSELIWFSYALKKLAKSYSRHFPTFRAFGNVLPSLSCIF